MSLAFGPVPPWSGSLSEKLVLLVLILGVVFVGGGIRSKSNSRMRQVLIFVLVTLIVLGIMVAFRHF
jgi:hypothetical protein